MKKIIFLFLIIAFFSTSIFAQLPCTATAKWQNIGGGVAALVLPYGSVADANMIQTTDQTVHITNLDIVGEVIRDLGGPNVPISISLNPPTGGLPGSGENLYRLVGPQIRLLEPALPVADRGVFTGTITISNDNGATSTTCTYVNGDLVPNSPAPSLTVSTVDGSPLAACDGTPGVTLAQGQTFNVTGNFTPPSGETATNIKVKHLVFSAGFASLEHTSETSYDNPSSPFDLSHTIDANAPTSTDFPIHIVQTLITYSDGSTLFCNAFVTVTASASGPSLTVSTVDGSPLAACDGVPGVTLEQGQGFNVTGSFVPPSGQTATNIKVKHLVFSAGFASLEHASETSYDNPSSPFDLSHAIAINAPTSADFPIHIVQALITYSDGSTLFCNAFVTVTASPSALSVNTIDGAILPACDGVPGVTLTQGQTFNVTGTFNPPGGHTVTNITVKHLVFSAGFANLEHASETSYDNPSSPFDLSHTIDAGAPISADFPIHIVQTLATFSDGSTLFCNGFVTVNPPAIPTMGQWGLIIFALIMVTLSVLTLGAPKMAMGNGQSVSTGINFKSLPFEKEAFFKYWSLTALVAVAIFVTAINFFGYELTNADPFGSFVASGMVAYILTLVKKYQ